MSNKNNPEKIVKVWINPDDELDSANAKVLGKALGFKDGLLNESIKILRCGAQNSLQVFRSLVGSA